MASSLKDQAASGAIAASGFAVIPVMRAISRYGVSRYSSVMTVAR
jgi:hypothetical protein